VNPDRHAALVTGGASGLGEATARALAAAGARVALLDRDPARLAQVADAIGGIGLVCDVTSEEGLAQAIAAAQERHGAARILVNCAGVAPGARVVGRDGPMALESFRQVVSVNLVGTFNAIRLFSAAAMALDTLDGDERAVIVNTASIAAFDGQIGQAAYAASKAGIVGMTLPIARELALSAIRVCTIAPGLFATPLMDGLPEQVRDALAATVPFPRRLGTPREFAALALHIVENAMLNGETIRLDGALRMAPR
jgi:NAD(P)-dependent dehydrogenase (short-subunit alcohol dehydrogenase family)